MFKKLLFALLPLCLVVSCSKEDKKPETACYKCTTAATVSMPGYPSSTSNTTNNYCNKTAAEIQTIKEQGTSTTTSGSGSGAITTRLVTSCSKQ